MRQVPKATRPTLRGASLMLALLGAVGLCVAGTASGAGSKPVTATTVTLSAAVCGAPVQKGNTTITHCENGSVVTGHAKLSQPPDSAA